jgi:tRNA dimethylallyltransferase
MPEKFLILIAGPTGVGKTELGIKLAQKFKSEIISCDSRQIYKELKKGTALPSQEQLKKVKHYFIGNKSVFDYYNASMFEMEVMQLLDKLYSASDIVFMVGGSGLYINSVIYGIDDIPSIDPEIRNSLKEKYEKEGLSGLRIQLKKLDPEYYEQVDLKNPKRILKALEICYMTGNPYSSFLTRKKKHRPFHIIKIVLNMNREDLYNRINIRVDKMIVSGLAEEAKKLISHKELVPLNTVGYKELFEYFEGIISLDNAIEKIKANSRKYARKQITWFRKMDNIKWFEPDQINDIYKYILTEIEKTK